MQAQNRKSRTVDATARGARGLSQARWTNRIRPYDPDVMRAVRREAGYSQTKLADRLTDLSLNEWNRGRDGGFTPSETRAFWLGVVRSLEAGPHESLSILSLPVRVIALALDVKPSALAA